MGKLIKNIQISAFVIILLQILLLGTFALFYFMDFFDLREIVNDVYLMIGASTVIFLDCLFVWVSIFRVSHLRNKTDLKAAEVLGNDIQAAYNFGMIGLVIVDGDNNVIWTNDLFRDRNINIIDSNIYTWKPELKKIIQGDEDKKVIVDNNRVYEVKYLDQAGLFIFKDVTDYESLFTYNKEQAPVFGLLTIDNYADVVGTEEDFNDSISKVKNVIFNYAREFQILLRRYRNDTYLMITNFKQLEKMRADGFSLIDKVRELEKNEDIPLTLSLGIAHDFPDVVKLSDMSEDALSIAMSRGGDQVVISKYGSEMEFIGGQSEAQEKRNRVKIRVTADSLNTMIKNSGNVFVMGHTKADMDAIGACLGIKAICDHLKKTCKVVIDLKDTEYKARSAMTTCFSRDELNEWTLSSKEAENKITANDLLIVVDVHVPNIVMAPKLLEKASKIVVIDHHRRAEHCIEPLVFGHIDPSASSACEIISEFIHYASIQPKIEVPAIVSTIMLSGIFLDSQFFKTKKVGIRTFEACTFLKEFGADNAQADELLKDDYEEYMIVNKIISNIVTPEPGIVYAIAPPDQIFDDATLAKAANSLLQVKAINAAFVMGKINNKEIKFSCRSDGTINVQAIAERMGGGGHFSMAAVVLKHTDFDLAVDTLKQALKATPADVISKEN